MGGEQQVQQEAVSIATRLHLNWQGYIAQINHTTTVLQLLITLQSFFSCCILFVCSSKSNSFHSNIECGGNDILIPKRIENEQIETDEITLLPIDIEESSNVPSVSNDDGKPINEDSNDNIDDEEGEDEFRRRVEEFIEKINRAWKAEKLATFSPYVHREQQLRRQLGATLVM
ncbi:hypothetical protein IFM89_023000 [Coptis chinensis]|uniref:Uncharacterized protein n=1 Tax=Coptis chinensis TaxID=261450 RepID=A0A835IED2_9MAGN|nr:hypothetical protein IFM89_023000 [Coptis chinensis]